MKMSLMSSRLLRPDLCLANRQRLRAAADPHSNQGQTFGSARLRFTRWCSRSSAQDSSGDSRGSLAVSKWSLIRNPCQSYFDPKFNLSKSLCSGISCTSRQRLAPLGGFHLAFAMLQLDNARPCGGSRGLERFAPAEREGAVAPGTLTPTTPFWKLCRATPRTRASPSRRVWSVNSAPSKGKPRRGKRGFQQRTAFGGSGGSWEAVLQTLVARASGGVQSGSGWPTRPWTGSGPAPSGANQRCSPALTSC